MDESTRMETSARRDALPEKVDVVVVGAGIAGASAAWHLTGAGVDVLLVDRGRAGGGATDAAVGVLSPPLRQPFHEMIHDLGEAPAVALWRFAERSITALGKVLRELDAVECTALDLSGGYVLAESHSDHEVRQSFEALERRGFAVEWFGADGARQACGGRGFTGGYRLLHGGALSPGPTARALVAGAEARGCQVREGVSVERVEVGERGVSCVTEGGARVGCDRVVYATHVDSGRFSDLLRAQIVPIRGQGIASELPAGVGSIGSFTTHWKLNVWRKTPGGRLLLGGWRHDAWDRAYGQTRPELDHRLQSDLQGWFEAMFPDAAPLRVLNRWSGIFGWTADYLPLVGVLPGRERELVISGFSGGGLPFAFEGGRVVAGIVAGAGPLEGAELLDPRRFT